MTEKELEALFRRSLGAHYSGKCKLWKHHADMFTGAGHPDFYGFVKGKFVAFELKVAPNRFSDLQKTSIRGTCELGGFAAGVLWCDEKAWLLPVIATNIFSYRNRTFWLPLPSMTIYGPNSSSPGLNLSALDVLLFPPKVTT